MVAPLPMIALRGLFRSKSPSLSVAALQHVESAGIEVVLLVGGPMGSGKTTYA
jgi:hypothetical protein